MEDECGLDGKQKAGGVEKLHHGVSVGQMETSGRLYRMCGEEDEFLREDGAPNDCGKLPHVSNSKSPWWFASSGPNVQSICLPVQ